MSDAERYAEEKAQEIEVLQSIYPEELELIDENSLKVSVKPENFQSDDEEPSHVLSLKVTYTPTYPDEAPTLEIEPLHGEFEEPELAKLLQSLQSNAQENLGMAMVFSLVTHLSEGLVNMMKDREAAEEAAHSAAVQKELDAEAAKRAGTAVTVESFNAWKKKFDQEMALVAEKEEQERIKALTQKERDEYKKFNAKLSGRQLFESNTNMDTSDSAYADENDVSVDISQYDRSSRAQQDEDEDEENHVVLSDSD